MMMTFQIAGGIWLGFVLSVYTFWLIIEACERFAQARRYGGFSWRRFFEG